MDTIDVKSIFKYCLLVAFLRLLLRALKSDYLTG